jgi:Fanconi-associated nuclease 1
MLASTARTNDRIACEHTDQSRYLFSRLLLRKPVWIRHSSLLNSASYTNDISDLPAACAELCQTVAGPSPKAQPRKEEQKPIVDVPEEKAQVKKEDDGVIDLTLSDTDDERPNRPFAPSPTPTRSAKAKGKGKAVAAPTPTVVPRTLVPPDSSDDLPDLSHFALDVTALTNENPEVILGLLSMEELVGLGKKMKVSCKGGATVRFRFRSSTRIAY